MLPRYIYQTLTRFKLRYLLLLSLFISLLLVSTVLAGQNKSLSPVIELSQINTPDYKWTVVTPTPIVLPSQLFSGKLNLAQTSNSIKNIVTVLEYGVNQNIPDNDPAGMTFAFNVTNDTALNEIELLFDITHAKPGELQISLTSPLSTTVVLSGTQQMQNAQLPNGLFHFVILNYQNEIPQGVWYLTVSDVQSSTIGIFNAWQISLQTNPHVVYLPIVFKTVSTYSFTPNGFMILPSIRLKDRPAVVAQSYQVALTTTPEKTETPGSVAGRVVPSTPMPRQPTLEVPGTGTPKPTLTPTPTVSPTPHVDPSGGFEGEQKIVWRTYSFKGHKLFFTPSTVPVSLPVAAYEGEWAAWLGGDDTELSWIETDLVVPLGKPYLFHYAYIQSYDSFCADTLFSNVTQSEALYYANGTTRTDLIDSLHSDVIGLIVSNATNIAISSPIDLCAANGGGWYLLIYDLTAFEEQKVTIRFKTISDSQATSSMIIDNVGFRGDFPINLTPVPTPFPRVRQNEGVSTVATKQPTPALPILIRKTK